MLFFRMMQIEIKKSISSNRVLCLVLLLSMISSYSLFIYYNDSFFSEDRKYLSSHMKTRSVELDFEEPISAQTAQEIVASLSESVCDYVLLTADVSTQEQPYRITSVSTLLSVRTNPYEYLYSSTSREACAAAPSRGNAYLNNKITTNRDGNGLYLGGAVCVQGTMYTISNFCALTYDGIELLLCEQDFWTYGAVDRMAYCFPEDTPLRQIRQINDQIAAICPELEIQINHGLTESDQSAYAEMLLLLGVLLAACVLNYYLIFSYLVKCRRADYAIMRLFGLNGRYMFGLLLLELLLYNLLAFGLSMAGFCVVWATVGDVSVITRIGDAVPVMLGFLLCSMLIGTYHVLRCSRAMPISYRESR